MPKRMRVALLGSLLVAVMTAGSGAAAESSPQEICALFPHGQTYRESSGFYQAPAWRYGGTVTVRYLASRCDVVTNGAVTRVAVAGTALVYQGEGIRSAPTARDFSFTMTARRGPGEEAWPLEWWGCTQTSVDYRWTIAGVYNFTLTARSGVWRATQASLGPRPMSASMSLSGCAS